MLLRVIGWKPGQLRLDRVRAWQQLRNHVAASAIRDRLAHEAGLFISNGDRYPGQHCLLHVGDRAVDFGSSALREQRRKSAEDEKRDQTQEQPPKGPH
jgi:hypothetical protein